MEVRGGEKLVHLAVLFGVFCAHLALGKYVKGIVNTKEVSAFLLSLFWAPFGLVATVAAAHSGQQKTDTPVSLWRTQPNISSFGS